MASERMRRIGQHGAPIFENPPPDLFRDAVSECCKRWDADHQARHRPAGLIYHYWDATALMNILKNRSTWATSTKYLNDTNELFRLASNFKAHPSKSRRHRRRPNDLMRRCCRSAPAQSAGAPFLPLLAA